jgi:nucleotide-binding universal stress UspA family protein
MFRRILLPVDGSTFAEHALPYAIDIAQRTRAELIISLVHVSHTPSTLDPAMGDALHAWDRAHMERESEYLHGLADRAGAETGAKVVPRLLEGEIIPSLEREVTALDVDLVVMSTHGRGGMERAWLGSVADTLVRHVDVPVLLITPTDDEPLGRDDARGYSHLLIALDGSERAERCIAPAIALAGAVERVTLLRAAAPPSAVMSPYLPHAIQFSQQELEGRRQHAQEYLAQQAEAARTPAQVAGAQRVDAVVVVDYHPARAILNYAAAQGVDLVALGTHGRSPAARLLLGSVTDKVVRAATAPVLVC